MGSGGTTKREKTMRRKWDPVSFRACLPACRDSGVEVLDASSMTDSVVHGNVLSEDGTHVWGFVDVMKAKLILSAMCS
jgi:hypothetical protein